MYRLTDQVRDLAVGYADVHVQQRRIRALCEFDGTKWCPIELVDESQLQLLKPRLRQLSVQPSEKDSGYSSAGTSTTGLRSPSLHSTKSYHSAKGTLDPELSDAQIDIATKFRRSSAFRLPQLVLDTYEKRAPGITEEEEPQDYDEDEADEETDVLRDMIIQQRAEPVPGGGGRRPSILASPSYQRNLINFADLAISEVDLSEENDECDVSIARQHILSAFPKQFEAEAASAEPLTTFTVYSRSEDYVEMLHVVLVLESRTVFWKLMGPSKQPVDKVTTLPYCWAADLDLPPLSLDEPRVTDEVECIIMGRKTESTILCDNHNDECRKCKGLASQDDCFACDGSGVFKKKPCVMCSGKGQYYCTTCKNAGHIACKTCGSTSGPRPILRQAYITCTRETVVSQSIEVEGDNKATLIATAKQLARDTVQAEQFAEGTLPVAACGVVIRQRGHVICATDLKSGARGLFEVVAEMDRVEFKGQLAPIRKATSRPASIHSNHSTRSTASKKGTSWFKRKEEVEVDDNMSIRSTASSRMRNMFRRS